MHKSIVKRDSTTMACYTFDSWSEYVDWCSNTKDYIKRQASEYGSVKFTKTSSFAEAIGLANNGWSKGLELVSEIMADIDDSESESSFVPRMESDVCGDFWDTGDVIAGVPDCARYMTEDLASRSGKIVDVYLNAGVSAGVSTAHIQFRGASVCSLVDALEVRGYRVNVTMSWASRTHGKDGAIGHDIVIPLKRSDSPMDKATLAFALIHPSALRRLGFRATEIIDKENGWTMHRQGYGCPVQSSVDSEVGIHMPHGRLGSVGCCKEWVQDMIRKYENNGE